ncbi:IS110 family transposase [Pedobacter foliorum]|uniref:IS110 family transposase n=3 Tax=Pedobacter foliorum TaxID=2739058 RepID=UPI0037C9694D
MEKIRFNSAGIDIGSQKIFIGLEGKEVASFGTFTSDFREASDYLKKNEITTVAMESTGTYWVILYDILQSDGFDVWLVDGRQTRQVPGRKTDVKDCQWIQQLHSYGLLNRCFVAEGKMKELRSYQRLREDHIRSAAMHVNHMQKALIEMNLRLPEVLSQIHGISGMAIIEAILSGEREPQRLLLLCHSSVIKNKSEAILKSLEGFYTSEGIFALKQAYEAYQFYQRQIKECDGMLMTVLQDINGNQTEQDSTNRKAIRHNKPDIENLGGQMLELFGQRDATILPGITDYSWLQIYSETGEDLTKWPSEKHFTSWLGLSPGQNNSGKKQKNKRKGRPLAGQIFRKLAQSLLQSKKISFGAFGRRLRGRKGPQIAIKAVARKLAVQYWRLMVKGKEFIEKGVAHYEAILLQQKEKYIKKLALELNMEFK